ncbi:MAG: PEP-CTERM sorting domain-containing protein [Armatimonadetes bacterium]|nr:PEP-CTERM sorting domain-containing protein [Armatimonadota bacterium]
MKKIAVLSLVAALSSFGVAQTFNVGFESPDYTTGALNGQNGWFASGGMDVSTDMALSGTQSLKVSTIGDKLGFFNFGSPMSGNITGMTSVFIDPSSADPDRVYGLQVWSGGFTSVLNVSIAADGSVRGGNGLVFDDPVLGSISNATGRWIEVGFAFTTGTSDAVLSVDGQSFNVSGIGNVADISDVDIVSRWINNSGTEGVAYFDDYMVTNAVPEPATLLGLSALGALALRRRKK